MGYAQFAMHNTLSLTPLSTRCYNGSVMRILTISDKIVPSLYSAGIRSQIGDVDLILSCGDLPYYYIDYIVSMLDKPAYFVSGNHAHVAEYWSNNTVMSAPGGATNLHGRTFCEQGLLLAGLEGSIRYNRAPFQYTDGEMWGVIARMIPGLLYNRMRYGRWLDVLVTHSPPKGIHDETDRAHTGFKSFLAFMRYFRPRYLLHGHIHIYRNDAITSTRYLETDVMNVYPYRILEIDP
ncbi:MAG: metallophosphoesterase [Caldilineaceae bacterium]